MSTMDKGEMIGVPNEPATSATGRGLSPRAPPLRKAGHSHPLLPASQRLGATGASRTSGSHSHTSSLVCRAGAPRSQREGCHHHPEVAQAKTSTHAVCLMRAVHCSGERHELRVRHSDKVTLHPRWLPRIGVSTVSVAVNAPPRRARGLTPVPHSLTQAALSESHATTDTRCRAKVRVGGRKI